MGKYEIGATRFREAMRRERDRQKVSRAGLSNQLQNIGFDHIHPSTVAKIESGERPVRLDEATAIADLLGVGLDTLLGRRTRPEDDYHDAWRAAVETGGQAAWQATSLERMLRDRVAQLVVADVDGEQAELVADLDRACDQLAEVSNVLTTAVLDRRGVIGRLTRKILRDMLDRDDEEGN